MRFSVVVLFPFWVLACLPASSHCWRGHQDDADGPKVVAASNNNGTITTLNVASSATKKLRRSRRTQGSRGSCRDGCDLAAGDFVCGEDGNTYTTECLAVCQRVATAHPGVCSSSDAAGGRVGIMDMFVLEGTVTRRTMKRFKGEGYNYVGRGKLLGKNAVPETPKLDAVGGSGTPSTPQSTRFLRVTSEGDVYMSVSVEQKTDDDLRGLIDTIEGYNPMTKEEAGNNNGEGNSGDDLRMLKVIGRDERKREAPLTSEYPYSTIAQIEFLTAEGNVGGCTGTVISRTSILTNAHCVYDLDRGSFYQIRGASPGRNRVFHNPFGFWTYFSASIYVGYLQRREGYDIAVIRLEPRLGEFIGDQVGFLGMARTDNADPAADRDTGLQTATITGYPGDKPPGSMWTSVCPNTYEMIQGRAFDVNHQCDTFVGSSGAALIDEDLFVRGTNFAEYLSDTQPYNLGNILRGQRFYDISRWAGLSSPGLVRSSPDKTRCLEWSLSQGRVLLGRCTNDRDQIWSYDAVTKAIRADDGNDCIDFDPDVGIITLYMRTCNGSAGQQWSYDFTTRAWTSLHPDWRGWYVTADEVRNEFLRLARFPSFALSLHEWEFPPLFFQP